MLLKIVIMALSFNIICDVQSSSEEEIYDIMAERVRQYMYQSSGSASSLYSRVTIQLNALQSDGSWPDIDYSSQAQTGWSPETHMNRVRDMAIAYTWSSSSLFENEALYTGIVNTLQFWYDQHPLSPNWWFQQIGIPAPLTDALILMKAGNKQISATLELNLFNRLIQEGGTPDQPGETGEGANKVNIASHYVKRGIAQKNITALNFGVEQAFSVLQVVNPLVQVQGLHHDYSWLQHGPQLYNGGYGMSFLDDITSLGYYTIGTDFQTSEQNIQNLIGFVDEIILMVRGKYFLYNVMGREVSRSKAIDKSTTVRKCVLKMKEINPSKADVYDNADQRLQEQIDPGSGITVRHKHYFRADYTLYTSPSYSFDVRIVSQRTSRCENGNNENLKGYFLSDGGTSLTVSGREYYEIFPVWDWKKIPGVTNPQQETIPIREQWSNLGKNNFSGGVSDGTYGVTAYEYNDQEFSVNTKAKKSWFFFGKEIVCLGAEITSQADEEVDTTINQCLRKGDVVYEDNWIWHDSVGYLIGDEQQMEYTDGEQSGSWYSINLAQSSTNVRLNIFKAWINHGVKPQDASYVYAVIPGISADEMKEYSKQPGYEVLSNQAGIQAVRQKSTGNVGIVFYEAGIWKQSDITVSVNASCILLVKNLDKDNSDVIMHIADAEQLSTVIQVKIETGNCFSSIQDCIMPLNPYLGSTVTYVLKNQISYDGKTEQECECISDDTRAFCKTCTAKNNPSAECKCPEVTQGDYTKEKCEADKASTEKESAGSIHMNLGIIIAAVVLSALTIFL
ncbi:MAG: putative chloramphenicol resistance protein [Streblomastix strix]|uniref:Putative chloramphenicol resistance protein n=1 Tax=Streblomastix strix TaxID=222440 RepID=A0A5J4WS07_9EUKA|nr:MAG: putative chloramphenicol resistance protein [Streblomastix strix]